MTQIAKADSDQICRFEFGIRHTKHGCTVWMDYPSGRRKTKRFQNSYALASVRAEAWVWEQRKIITESAKETGRQVEFIVPPDLDRTTDRQLVVLPIELWDAIDDAVEKANVGRFAWIEQAVKEKLAEPASKNEKLEDLIAELRALAEEIERHGDYDPQFGIGAALDRAWKIIDGGK